MIQVTPVILCGGSGSRLWPLSRTGFPKQFLCLTGADSLFQQAAQRLSQLGNDTTQLGAALLEPMGRNTAPALTLAALAATDAGQDPILVVTPADQTVTNTAAFTQAMQQAFAQAATGSIVILGIQPDRPETGYGYIHAPHQGEESSGAARQAEGLSDAPRHCEEHSDVAIQALPVQAFVEKPNLATAEG